MARGRKKTTKEFISESIEIHGDTYDYSETEYFGYKKELYIICKIHGGFYQTPNVHLIGCGCQKCSNTATSNSEEFIKKAIEIHGDTYGYSEVDYTNTLIKVDIICKVHGLFKQLPHGHLKGRGCRKCGLLMMGSKMTGRDVSTTEAFIKKAIEVHGDKYGYSKVNYTMSKNKVNIICGVHGLFKQRPNSHLSGKKCPICKRSKGEEIISKYFDSKNIIYVEQKKIEECRNINRLPFDFYVPHLNLLIEYQGIQHYKAVGFFGGQEGFKYRQKNDKIKRDFAKANGFRYLEISYKDKEDIETILEQII